MSLTGNSAILGGTNTNARFNGIMASKVSTFSKFPGVFSASSFYQLDIKSCNAQLAYKRLKANQYVIKQPEYYSGYAQPFNIAIKQTCSISFEDVKHFDERRVHHFTPRVGPVNGVTSIKPLSFYIRRPFDYNITNFSSWCLSFRYFSKNVSISISIGSQSIWKTSQPSSYQWVMRQVDIPIPMRPTEISFHPEIVENDSDFKSKNTHDHPHLSDLRNYVGVDDIDVLPYSCNTADLNCNYNTKHDIDACLWKVSGGMPIVKQAEIRESLPNIVGEAARKRKNALYNVGQLVSPILSIQEPLYPIMCFQMTYQVIAGA